MTRSLLTSLCHCGLVAFVAFSGSCVQSGASDRGSAGGAGSHIATSPANTITDASLTGDAVTMAKAMGFGVNIGNTLESTNIWETGWGQPLITQTYINGLANHGIRTVRVPVAWDTYAVNGVIAPEKMARVHQVVQWIIDADMYAIVNIHWDNGWIHNEHADASIQYQLTDDVRAKFASYWAQISTAFADVGDHLVLEAMNEERFVTQVNGVNTPDYAALNELNQTFVNTVREGGGANESRALLIAGYNTSIESTCVDAFKVSNDPAGTGKLFLSIHYYDPYTFCQLATPDDKSKLQPVTTWGTAAEQAAQRSSFNRLTAFSLARNIPVILGEFAVTLGSGQYVRESASRILWMASVASASFAGNMVPVLWDTGTDVNRIDGSLSPDFQAAMTQLGQ